MISKLYWFRQTFHYDVVNRALMALYGSLLEITFTVSLTGRLSFILLFKLNSYFRYQTLGLNYILYTVNLSMF